MAENLDMSRIPEHVAIIMDGNGRWAVQRGKERSYGHQAGVEAVRRITSECTRLGVKYLTLYTFSTENWNRPADEIVAGRRDPVAHMQAVVEQEHQPRPHAPAGHGDGRIDPAGLVKNMVLHLSAGSPPESFPPLPPASGRASRA